MKSLLGGIIFCVVSCQPGINADLPRYIEPAFPERSPKIGVWRNKYENDPRLAGVIVQQHPDSPDISHVGQHPCMIQFVMWNGRVEQVSYKPSGEVAYKFWWTIDIEKEEHATTWSDVDYSYGSDPAFRNHEDPRKNT